ncbi:low-density lipoprotein receptor domain class A domain-containing protein [Ditylenchus destructor]|uniref:Low-density lipoprotein receptor domain class A domain-containing protein n=1 Tax=Ditylenchus destructor TaxID=166010 RepID=A0AAD4RB95_9BILA|nr:low-density lipoprotein receptor domain class A domain-containing protein [Ditylenchus destructor]
MGATPLFSALILILIFFGLALTQNARSNTESNTTSKCENETSSFICHSDNSCIPREWVADGEKDCPQGEDEETTSDSSVQKPESGIQGRNRQPKSHVEAAAKNEDQVCSPQVQAKINRCSSELQDWVANSLEQSIAKSSLLHDSTSVSIIEQGCQLATNYTDCVAKKPAACNQPSPSVPVQQWLNTQMYMCELLVPSIREHSSCFGSSRSPQCPILGNVPSENSPLCSLITRIMGDINCLERSHGDECDDAAIEMMGPMRSETEHVLSDLNCSLPAPSDEDIGDSAVESTPEQVQPALSTSAPTSNIPVPTGPAQGFRLDLTNSLAAFRSVDAVCAQIPADAKKIGDLWAPIRVKICARKEELKSHAQCFQTAEKGQTGCSPILAKNTSCGAIDAFNKHIDCIIKSLNDVCSVEAQDIVIDIQEKLNDEAIGHKCYQQKTDGVSGIEPPINNDGFTLKPISPRCNSEQENAALVCLVELVEINRQLANFQSLNFLLEVSNPNSTVINGICSLYEKYEKCLNTSVFKQNSGARCSFNSPLNTLARIGLSPVCGTSSRELLISSRDCLLEVSRQNKAVQCQSGLHSLGPTVNLMLQGIHGEALLCKSFYSLRNSFQCGAKVIQEHCESHVFEDLNRIQQQMSSIGLEEGCPADPPQNLDEIISRPVNPQSSGAKPPIARPIPQHVSSGPQVNAGSSGTSPASNIGGVCEPEEQKNFGLCVQPLTAFQPHPLAVIKQPKQIDEACQSFKNFNTCRENVKCNPLWARGMSAMFEYACGDGYERYTKVRQCIRRTTTRTDIRECVVTFSKGAPQEACQSSNRLLACALPPINEKCGNEAVEFVQEYVKRFAAVIDPQCRVGEEPAAKAITTFNCTANEDQIVQHCSAPLNDIHSRLDQLFEGGLQAFLRNVNNLAPVFAQGCNLTSEFRECSRSVLQSNTSCVVSSCLIQAGSGICDQPDVAAAIENNLGCVFKQISDPNFGKCLRSTISTLKQFNLEALRGILPQFVECVEPIVMKNCGVVPLNVLKALSSKNVCPISLSSTPLPHPIVPIAPKCTQELRSNYDQCQASFNAKYSFAPISLFNASIVMDDLCGDVQTFSSCIESTSACEQPAKEKAVHRLANRLCSNRNAFEQRRDCMLKMVSSVKGNECLRSYVGDETSSEFCGSLNTSTSCLSEDIYKSCPPETVSFIYDHTNEYLQGLELNNCQLFAPTVSIQTGCNDQDLIQFLECESIVDKFRLKPVSLISDPSKWEEFCGVVKEKYRPCIEALPCRFEPVNSASLALFTNVCDVESTHSNQIKFGNCLNNFTSNSEGKSCVEPFSSVDLLTRDSGEKICPVIDSILNCSTAGVGKMCGNDALLHVYDVHNTWMQAFKPSCALHMPEAMINELGTDTPAGKEESESHSEAFTDLPNTTLKNHICMEGGNISN